MTSETTTNDQATLLCNATPEQMARFEAAARAAGHASGKSAANDWNLWGDTVARAIEAVSGGNTDADDEETTTFRPTHRITLDSGETRDVMLDDGRAYTRDEWDAYADADYERTNDGRWLFQGQPFAGRVERIAEDA